MLGKIRPRSPTCRAATLALLLALAAPGSAPAQPAPPGGAGPANAGAGPQRPAEGRRLPPDVTSEHLLELPGRTLKVTATAGSLPLVEPGGAVVAEIAYVSYRVAGSEAANRPVLFAVNGGPGASSAYLHLLAVGPWRLPLEGATVSPSMLPALVPNAETWLDFTDLVFLDPVGTGYSRANGSAEEVRERYYSVEGDVSSLAAIVARWLRANDRLASPKFFMGESYGGFRGPLLARALASETGIALSGMVLVSPVLDFGWLSQPRHGVLEHVARLPSLAASAQERVGAATRESLAEAERYAAGEYLSDLLRGPRDQEALGRMTQRLAELTGLPESLVRQRAGRIDLGAATRELRRGEGRVVSIYDTGISTFDPEPSAASSGAPDALLDATKAPLASAAIAHLAERLGWRVPNARYELLNGSVSGGWRYGRGRRAPDAMDELKGALAADPAFRVLVAHGLTDLVTPYFASELLLRQVPAYGDASRLTLATYGGGHMFYTRDAARAAFREDGRDLFWKALAARAKD